MPKKTFTLGELADHQGEIAVASEEELERTKREVTIPAFTPELVLDNRSVERVFVTKFYPEDVEDFRKILQANLPQRFQETAKANLSALLINAIREWLRIHTESECFVEPFLWALKETDNYIGSIAYGNSMPPPWIVDEVGCALLNFWKNNNDVYSAVLRNVLLKWDWYQPLHLMMNVYSGLDQYHDEALDKKLREEWLHRIYYANAVIKCLCKKPHTRENIHALMTFVSVDKQQDMLQQTTPINVTKKMRETVCDYLRDADEKLYAYAKEYYTANKLNFSVKAKKEFDWVFRIIEPKQTDDIEAYVNRWAKAGRDSDELQDLEVQLVYMLDDKNSETTLIETAGTLPNLTQRIATYYGEKQLSYQTQFPLGIIARQSGKVPAYRHFLEQRYLEKATGLHNKHSVQIGCAYCLTGHPEMVEPLARAIFLFGLGEFSNVIFLDIIDKYSKQYKAAVEKIRDECLKDIRRACTLLTNCTAFIPKSSIDRKHYPTVFDEVCKFVLKEMLAQLQDNGNVRDAVQYGKALVRLIEKVADVINRGNYKEMLEAIINAQTEGAFFDVEVKEPAKKIYKNLYPL